MYLSYFLVKQGLLSSSLFVLLQLVVLCAVSICACRLYLMLPAQAVNDTEMSLQKSWHLTRGCGLKIFGGLLLVAIPGVALSIILGQIASAIPSFSDSHVLQIIFTFLAMSVSFFDACLKASFLSHLYQYYMYFLIYPTLNIESLYFPNFLKGVGHGILYISLTIYVAKTVPFKHFFQGLCVLSFIRTSISTPLGTAILTRCLKYMQRENLDRQCWKIDEVGEWVPDVPIKQLYAELVQSSLTTSLKELFGVVCIIGTILLIFILNYKLLKKLYISFKRHRLKITAKMN